jgi:hypothetical protein
MWRIVGYIDIEMNKRNIQRYYLQAKLENNFKYSYRAITRTLFGFIGSLPIITKKDKLYSNDIVTVKLNSILEQYATGRVYIFNPYY